MTGHLEQRLASIRGNIAGITAALPGVPAALAAARGRLQTELSATGGLRALLLLAAFVGLGVGAQVLYRRLTRPALAAILAAPVAVPRERVRAAMQHLGWQVGWLAAFALASVGGFLLFDWPPLLQPDTSIYRFLNGSCRWFG